MALICTSAALEAGGVTVLILLVRPLGYHYYTPPLSTPRHPQVAVRVNPIVTIGLMGCIFWLPRPELLSYIRTALDLDKFYGAHKP